MNPRHRGFFLMEIGIAAIVLGSLLTLVTYLLVESSGWRRESQNRAMAMQLASSLLEQCVGLPRNELNDEKVAELAKSQQAEALLPDETVELKLDDAGVGGAKGKRISVEVSWKSPSGNLQGPVRLATWVFDSTK